MKKLLYQLLLLFLSIISPAIKAMEVTLASATDSFDASSESFPEDAITLSNVFDNGTEEQINSLLSNLISSYGKIGIDLTELLVAVQSRHYKLCKFLLKRGYPINKTNNAGLTPLHDACSRSLLKIARLLIRSGAQVDAQTLAGTTPLIMAADKGMTHTCEFLIAKHADVAIQNKNGFNALMTAAYNGSADIVALLLFNGADITATSQAGLTALDYAQTRKHEAVVQILTRAHAAQQETAMIAQDYDKQIGQALVEGNFWYIKSLLDSLSVAERVKLNPLLAFRALEYKQPSIALLLLSYHVAENSRDRQGNTLLIKASQLGLHCFVEALLAGGVAIDERNNEGKTALHYAAINDDCGMITLLLSHGANAFYFDYVKLMPIDYAKGQSVQLLTTNMQSPSLHMLSVAVEVAAK